MRPQIFQVFSQTTWPGIGDIDDCWVLASMQAVHAVAPWLKLPGVKRFRAEANRPDSPNRPDPGDEHDMARALRRLYPDLRIEVVDGGDFSDFAAKVESGRPAALIVRSSALPDDLQHGFKEIHAITVAFDDELGWVVANPLAKAHSKPEPIQKKALEKAVKGFKPNVHAVLMPTLEEALETNEIHREEVTALRSRIKKLKDKVKSGDLNIDND